MCREPGKSPPAEVMDRLARLESKLDSLTNSVTQLASLVTPQISLGAKRGNFDRQRAGEVSAGGSEAGRRLPLLIFRACNSCVLKEA